MVVDRKAVLPLMLAPATAYRELLYRPGSELSRCISESFEIIAAPGRALTEPPQAGDVLLAVTLGQPGRGECGVLIDGELTRQRSVSGGQPGYYATVAGADAMGRHRILDMSRRIAPGHLVLRQRDGIASDTAVLGEETKVEISIASIHFAFAGNADVHAMYLAANSHPALPGVSLDWWARGAKITDPEWLRGRRDSLNKAAVVTRNKRVRMRVKLECATSVDLPVTLTATPTLDGSAKHLKEAKVIFSYPANAASHTVDVELASTMPDEVGRFQLNVKWQAEGANIKFAKHTTAHTIYSAYGRPLKPDYDSASLADAGQFTDVADGTLTATRKRLDQLTALLGTTRRVPAKTQDDLIELLWKLHVGINDTPGAPPYFDAGHDRFLTIDGSSSGTKVPIDDQWLAWLVTRSPHWNDASCIGHVQLLKTMAAAMGIFVRRTWVYPTTKTLPDKSNPAITDTDCYSLGQFDSTRSQKWKFTHGGVEYWANPKLMEPNLAWENFEACMLTSQGRFLTGGYSTSANPRSFTTDRGFKSAKDLLRWWSNTKRPRFGKRFMAWVYYNRLTNEAHFWDVDGKHYAPADYVKIRDTGKELPPP